MNSILLIALLSVSLCALPLSFAAHDVCEWPLTKEDCPLFAPSSDMVTTNGMRNVLANSPEWIILYIYEMKSKYNYGSCTYRFIPKPGAKNRFFRRTECYNLSKKKCASFDVDVKLKEDSCGRAMFESVPGSIPQVSKFYSQNPNQYMWHDLCYGNRCSARFFELLVKSDRVQENGVVDHTGLPLDQIAADLAKIQNKKFGEKEIRFAYTGPEQACPLE